MRPQDHARSLQRISEIRVVQRRAAEERVARAAVIVEQLNEQKDQSVQALLEDERRWENCISQSLLSLPLARAFSAEILRREDDIRLVDRDIAEAKAEKSRKDDAWRLALAQENIAEDLARSARRVLARQNEEAALNEAADRFMHRRVR